MPEVNTNYFPIMVKAENEAALSAMHSLHAFLRRTSDGKFYRGARWWRWCRSWRNAAVLPIGFWRTWIFPKLPEDLDVEFVFLEQLD